MQCRFTQINTMLITVEQILDRGFPKAFGAQISACSGALCRLAMQTFLKGELWNEEIISFLSYVSLVGAKEEFFHS